MIFVTHEKASGRAGHQYKDAITPLIVAELFALTYVCTPYKSLQLFNLEEGEPTRADLPKGIVERRMEGPYWLGIPYDTLLEHFSKLQRSMGQADCLVVLANNYRVQLFQLLEWHSNGLLKTNMYETVLRRLRKKFQARNPAPADAHKHRIKIAVHVRRGDVANPQKIRVPSSQHYSHRMDFYDGILRKLKSILNGNGLEIHVYTEHLNADDVVAYCNQRPDIVLHQGGKQEFGAHFCEMVYCDILVVSNSSMSQMAGYLSEGVKIYHPNDQYHSLPPHEFIKVTDLEQGSAEELTKLLK